MRFSSPLKDFRAKLQTVALAGVALSVVSVLAATAACGDSDEGGGLDCAPRKLEGAGGGCQDVFEYACGAPEGVDLVNSPDCNAICPGGASGGLCSVQNPDAGPGERVLVQCTTCAIGRRPAGYAADASAPTTLGAYFACVAELEAASIDSFEILARELSDHGAPIHLVAEARRAADDERRHAKTTRGLAVRFGGAPAPVAIAHGPTRSRFAMALENAVEGCVRETFGAVVAFHQAARAGDPGVRRAMRAIEADEARHAELSWKVAAFLEPHLDAAERAAVDEARLRALSELAEAARAEPSSELVRVAGLPKARVAARLVADLEAELFGTANAA